jgi:hypothetical protein
MGILPVLLANTTPLVSRFSVKCQRNVSFKATVLMLILIFFFQFRQSLQMFPVTVSNNYSRISGKMSFTIEDKALIIDFSRGRQPIKRLCLASTHMCTIKLRQMFR